MEKNLVPFGNSVGVVIDKALCRVLDVKRGSRVRVTTDGRRLLIEPLREDKSLTALELADVKAVVEQLVVYLHVPERVLTQLHPGLDPFRIHARARTWAGMLDKHPSAEDQIYVRRFRVCYEKVRGGAAWDAAVAAALEAAPDLPVRASCG